MHFSEQDFPKEFIKNKGNAKRGVSPHLKI
jgi:hypothetical protein